MNYLQISNSDAAKLVLTSQLLTGKEKFNKGKSGIIQIINKLGYIQIDTISVINRAHHHILWTRKKNYSEKQLHELQSKDKRIYEYWTHAMSFIPIEDYRYSIPRMRNFEKPKSAWLKYRFNQSKSYFKPVLERIKNEGPLSSGDFENDTGEKGGTWWMWKPSKTALEYLFWRGDLMVWERRGFQKYYDLTERVLPKNVDTSYPSNYELSRFFIKRALTALGVAPEKEILKFMQPGKSTVSDLQVVDKTTMKKRINELCEAGEIIPVLIENDHKVLNYILTENINSISKKKKSSAKIHLLSPFDNLIIQRDRTKRLFNFDYAIECYLPLSKRKYGYFVLPILWGSRFAGRLDPKADRKNKTFIINNLVLEEEIKDFEQFLPLLADKLISFAQFNGCENIIIKKSTPNVVKPILRSLIKEIA